MILNNTSFISVYIALVHFFVSINFKLKIFYCKKFVFNKTRINDSLCLEYKQHAIGF